MGRDRDPFDKTIAALRDGLAKGPPLQGATLSINGVAQSLAVSQTPVREALATLAGEGLIVRTPAGYAAAVHDPGSLAALYDLAAVLEAHAIGGLDADSWPLIPAEPDEGCEALLAALVAARDDPALGQAYRRVAAQLAPFVRAADALLADGAATRTRIAEAWRAGDRRALLRAMRAHRARRRRESGRVLAAAIGLVGPR